MHQHFHERAISIYIYIYIITTSYVTKAVFRQSASCQCWGPSWVWPPKGQDPTPQPTHLFLFLSSLMCKVHLSLSLCLCLSLSPVSLAATVTCKFILYSSLILNNIATPHSMQIGAMINLTGYYIIGLPAAAAFAFPLGLGIMGLWLGLTLSIFVQVAVFYVSLGPISVCFCAILCVRSLSVCL